MKKSKGIPNVQKPKLRITEPLPFQDSDKKKIPQSITINAREPFKWFFPLKVLERLRNMNYRESSLVTMSYDVRRIHLNIGLTNFNMNVIRDPSIVYLGAQKYDLTTSGGTAGAKNAVKTIIKVLQACGEPVDQKFFKMLEHYQSLHSQMNVFNGKLTDVKYLDIISAANDPDKKYEKVEQVIVKQMYTKKPALRPEDWYKLKWANYDPTHDNFIDIANGQIVLNNSKTHKSRVFTLSDTDTTFFKSIQDYLYKRGGEYLLHGYQSTNKFQKLFESVFHVKPQTFRRAFIQWYNQTHSTSEIKSMSQQLNHSVATNITTYYNHV